MNLQQKPSTASEPLNSSTYERHLLHGSPYLTSQWCMAPSTWLTHQLEEDVGCKVPHFINNEDQEVAWSQNPMVYKHSSFFTKKMRRFKSSIKPLSLDFTISVDELIAETFYHFRTSELFNIWMSPFLLHESQHVTNSPTWRRLLAAKFFTSSTMKIKKYLVTKP